MPRTPKVTVFAWPLVWLVFSRLTILLILASYVILGAIAAAHSFVTWSLESWSMFNGTMARFLVLAGGLSALVVALVAADAEARKAGEEE